MASSLPAGFRSVYRLFLRALSASVLHHPAATRNLRRLYRPVFVEAAAVCRGPDSPAAQRWMNEFHQRVDITLALLLSSARSNGLPHQLTKNLANMMDIYQAKLHTDFHMRRASAGVWQGQNFKPVMKRITGHSGPRASIRSNAWSTLGELIEFAEGDTGILTGKLQSKMRKEIIAHWDVRL